MDNHYNDPFQYLTWKMCKINKNISYYRFKYFRGRLCVHLHRYRFGHTRDIVEENAASIM